MHTRRSALSLTAALVFGVGAVALPTAQQGGESIAVPLTDAGRPAGVRVSLMNGTVTVRGENRKDVLVTTREAIDTSGRGNRAGGRGRGSSEPPAGLRRLNQRPGLTIVEENNQVTIEGSGMTRSGDIELRVPTRTNLVLNALNGGDTVIENVDGEIEAANLNAGIRMTNVAGSVVANSHNGNVVVTLTRITGDKAMAFTSFNGNVDVTLPANAKANLRLQSDNGDIYTDFDVQVRPAGAPQTSRRSDGRVRIEVNQSIFGSINGGGPEFDLRTFNGQIYVRRGAQ
jgi:hypothetical protein